MLWKYNHCFVATKVDFLVKVDAGEENPQAQIAVKRESYHQAIWSDGQLMLCAWNSIASLSVLIAIPWLRQAVTEG
jgi:hypothetical protein